MHMKYHLTKHYIKDKQVVNNFIYTQGQSFQSDNFDIININNTYIDVFNKQSFVCIFLFVSEGKNHMN